MDVSGKVVAPKDRKYCSVCSNYRWKVVNDYFNVGVTYHVRYKNESQGRVDDHENEDEERVCESMATACGDAGSSASEEDDTGCSNYSYISGGDRLNDSLNFHSYSSQTAACNDSFRNKETQTSVCCLRDACTQTDAASSVTSTGTQTDAANSSADVEIQTVRPCFTIEDIENDDSKILFYTGIPNRVVFHALFDEVKDCVSERERGRPRFLRSIDEFFMVLMRLRLGLLLGDLADRFNVSIATCSQIFNKWIDYLTVQLINSLIVWTSKDSIAATMPYSFRRKYSHCRVIIDCTELFVETPSSLQNKSLLYSHYKSHMTYKALIGISPAGVTTFASDLWAGSISDKQLSKECGLLDLCEVGDGIMADKGFVISDLTPPRGIHLIIPPFKQKKSKLSKADVALTREIACLWIHVERQKERIKNFHILEGNMRLSMASQASKIWKICVALTNLLPPLCQVPQYDVA